MKSLSASSNLDSNSAEINLLREENHFLKDNEQKLNQEIHKLQSLLDDQKSINISNETLLSLRFEYIKALQETDDINKIRLTSISKDLLNYKKQIKEFETFKAAHEEEKRNFESLLNNMREENIELETEKRLFEERLKHKIFKNQKRTYE